ncbi:MAG: VWA domain-containing protein [Pirellulales bacterium]
MDASISLQDDRQQIAERLERVYAEISTVTAEGSLHPEALSSAVLSFGNQTRELVAPTNDGQQVVAAIRDKVPVDATGVENVFTAVNMAANKYRVLSTRGDRKLMFVIWTDESGDDVSMLDEATNVCQRLGVSVYTVGPSAMFGREMGTMAYRHPDDGEVYLLPVKRGPDSVRQEQVELPFWFGRDAMPLRAGVGPFALTRLAYQTGGAYFINDARSDRSPFDATVMRRYLPAYTSPQQYQREVAASPLRTAVLRAVDVTRQHEVKGTPRLEFAPTGENFQDELREAQETAAYNLHVVELALGALGDDSLDEQYHGELSPRWRAWYDLTMGRLLAMYVRSLEYNWACAVMKGKGAEFVNTQSNRWKFVPDEQLKYGTATERRAEQARMYLERCAADNAGTPWAVIAEHELRYPFGFRVAEAFVPPPPPRNTAAGNNRRPRGRSEEQLRMLSREPQVNLPKL